MKSCVKYIFLIGFLSVLLCQSALAQWSFTPTIHQSGCTGIDLSQVLSQANAALESGFRTVGFPTLAECEAARNSILSNKVSGQNYAKDGPCTYTIYWTCTPCSGHDMSSSALTPTDAFSQLKELGPEEGMAFSAPNTVESITAWFEDYERKYNSMEAVDVSNLLTGDTEYDEAYTQGLDYAGATVRENSSDYVWGTIDPAFLKQSDPEIPSSTTGQGRGVNLVDRQYLMSTDTFSLKDSYVPKPVATIDDGEIEHPLIDMVTEDLVAATDFIPGKPAQALAVANVYLYSELAKAGYEGYHDLAYKSTSDILVNALNKTTDYLVEQYSGPQYAESQLTEAITDRITEKGVTKALTVTGRPITEDVMWGGEVAKKGSVSTGSSIVSNAVNGFNLINTIKDNYEIYKEKTRAH